MEDELSAEQVPSIYHFFWKWGKRRSFVEDCNYTLKMVKKSKLLAALDAHKGRDYAAEKEKKQRKEAEKKKRLKDKKVNGEENNTVVEADGAAPVLQEESEGWESDESDVAELNAVCNPIVLV